MKKKELEALRKKEVKDLAHDLKEARQKASLTWSKMVVGKEKNLKAGRSARRQIAQLSTIITEKMAEITMKEVEKK